jgi:hypothetical protein
MMKGAVICLLAGWFSVGVLAQQTAHPTEPVAAEIEVEVEAEMEIDDDLFGESSTSDFDFDDESNQAPVTEPSFLSELLEPTRFTLKHELSYRPVKAKDIVNNRSSMQLEFSKFFLNNFYVRLDSKVTALWGNDHRAQAQNKDVLVKTNTRESFLQASFGDTSIKVGTQVLIWGESDGGAITDVISPRNFSELFYISLEESRLGQSMINIEQFSAIGDWNLFYVPNAKFNRFSQVDTAYYLDPFNGQARYLDEANGSRDDEYGLRWKKTFGKSDFALMAASMIDNNQALRQEGIAEDGKLLISRVSQRYTMAGVTFNYSSSNLLFKGEVAVKSAKAFNNSALELLEKDVLDTAFGVNYSLGGNDSVSLELVNNHIANFDEAIVGVPRNSSSLVLTWMGFFFNEDLSVNWMTTYSKPFTGVLHSLRTSYKYSDNVIFNFDSHIVDVNDQRSSLYPYRDQEQLVFKMQYQF